ncbi:unnamed protein product, partial [Cuscuta europaea]
MNVKPPVWGEGFKAKSGQPWSNTGIKNTADNKGKQPWYTPAGVRVTEINPSGIKRVGPQLSQEEYQDRSRRGLCFKCGEKWSKEHTCKLKNYKLILVEDSDEEVESESTEPELAEEEEINMESKTMQLSVMSREGIPSMKAFKVRGSLKWSQGEFSVEALIDSGATHNFISQELVE